VKVTPTQSPSDSLLSLDYILQVDIWKFSIVATNCWFRIQSMSTTEWITSVRNGSRLPSSGRGWNQTRGPALDQTPPGYTNRLTSAGILPRPDINQEVFGPARTAPWFNFKVPATLPQLWSQWSIWVLIVLWHDQSANCAVLCAVLPPAVRFAIRPIFVELLWN